MPTYVLIASNILASTTSSVNFNNIPNTYTDLVLRVSARTIYAAPTDLLQITFNSTSTGYSLTKLRTNSSTVTTSRQSNQSLLEIGNISGGQATADVFGSVEIYIPSYTSSKNKQFTSIGHSESNNADTTQIGMELIANFWQNTSPISSISISPFGTFAIGSSFFLYGISNT